jgi:hypothetical protein
VLGRSPEERNESISEIVFHGDAEPLPNASRVLQIVQKYPEIAGSERRWFAKPDEMFQWLSPELDSLLTKRSQFDN